MCMLNRNAFARYSLHLDNKTFQTGCLAVPDFIATFPTFKKAVFSLDLFYVAEIEAMVNQPATDSRHIRWPTIRHLITRSAHR